MRLWSPSGLSDGLGTLAELQQFSHSVGIVSISVLRRTEPSLALAERGSA